MSATLLERPDVNILDTNLLDWQDLEGNTVQVGDTTATMVMTKTLSTDADGDPIITMRWLSSDRPETERPPRGYYLAREFYFFLAGETLHWELDPELPPEHICYRPGFISERQPCSVHGTAARRPISHTSLNWLFASADPLVGTWESRALISAANTGAPPFGTGAGISAAQPSVQQPSAARVVDRPRMRVLDSSLLEWEPHPYLPGTMMKPLSSREEDGDPTITLLSLPPGPFPAPSLPVRAVNGFREFALLLSGELAVWQFDGREDRDGTRLVLRPGCWLDRRPGSVYGFGAESASRTGAVLLHWRTRAGAQFVKAREKYPVWCRSLEPGERKIALRVTDEDWRRDLEHARAAGLTAVW